MSAFAASVDALFADGNVAEDALWKPGSAGPGLAVRAIRIRPDRTRAFGESRAVFATMLIDVRRSEAATIAEGDLVMVGVASYRIIATPLADELGLVLRCEATEA